VSAYRTLEITELVWNEWNVEHIARHGLTPPDVEAACTGVHIATDTYKQRVLLIGTTEAGQAITVILDQIEKGQYFPVTARPASRKERQTLVAILGKEAA